MSKLTKTIKMEELGSAMVELAKKEAEETLTRSLVGLNKAMPDIKKAGKRVAKAVLFKLPSMAMDNEIVDSIADASVAYQLTIGAYNGYNAGKKFVKGYSEATDEDVEELNKLMGI